MTARVQSGMTTSLLAYPVDGPTVSIFRSSPERWPNIPVRPYVHNQTQCSHKPNSGIC